MHCHQSLFGLDGNNLFDGNDEFHLSKLAYQFISGQLKHARAPQVYSQQSIPYKRLVPGYEAPVYWLGSDKPVWSALIRIPRHTAGMDQVVWRIALSRPFLQPIPCLYCHAGSRTVDGADNAFDIPKPLNNINIYHLDEEERARLGVRELPGSLLDALHELDQDVSLTNALIPPSTPLGVPSWRNGNNTA